MYLQHTIDTPSIERARRAQATTTVFAIALATATNRRSELDQLLDQAP